MLAMAQMMRDVVIAQPLHLQRDPHSVGGGGTVIIVQDDVAHGFVVHDRGWPIVTSIVPMPSTPPVIVSPGLTAPTPAGVPVKIRSPACNSTPSLQIET